MITSEFNKKQCTSQLVKLSMKNEKKHSFWRGFARIALGGFLMFTGIGHLTFSRKEFLAQVPNWVPLDPDLVVVLSGVAEVGLGLLLISGWKKPMVGLGVAIFFVAVFPGNISQFLTHTDAFGLNSDLSRGVRLLFQPLLVAWVLWSTGAWETWKNSKNRSLK